MAPKAKKTVNPLDQMTPEELQARRIQLAEQTLASGVHWTRGENGEYISSLTRTDYWEIVKRLNQPRVTSPL